MSRRLTAADRWVRELSQAKSRLLHCRGDSSQTLRAEPGHRRHRLLEFHLHRRFCGALARHRRGCARTVARPHDTVKLGAHRPIGRLPLGPCRHDRCQAALPQPPPHPGRRVTCSVPGPFALGVVYLTTDAIPSSEGRTASARKAWHRASCGIRCMRSINISEAKPRGWSTMPNDTVPVSGSERRSPRTPRTSWLTAA